MKLYILRHGIAEDAALGQSDESRELTEEGRKKTRRVLERAAAADVHLDVILTSPYPRARATAEIAREALQFPADLIETEQLVPYASVFDVWEEIRNYPHANELMVVGHNPLLSDLATWLVGARDGAIMMKKAALATFEIGYVSPQPRGSLIWLLTPKSAG